jgi:hypothetical protein
MFDVYRRLIPTQLNKKFLISKYQQGLYSLLNLNLVAIIEISAPLSSILGQKGPLGY